MLRIIVLFRIAPAAAGDADAPAPADADADSAADADADSAADAVADSAADAVADSAADAGGDADADADNVIVVTWDWLVVCLPLMSLWRQETAGSACAICNVSKNMTEKPFGADFVCV